MTKFELIPHRLYLSQSKTWMHKVKAQVKIYVLLLVWISIFILSYQKLLIIVCSLIITSNAIKCNQDIVKKHFVQTLGLTILTMLFSFSLTNSSQNYLTKEQLTYRQFNREMQPQKYIPKPITDLINQTPTQVLLAIKPASYFFITIYSIKLVMITTSSEILAITIYRNKVINKIVNEELLFTFLLSSQIVNSIIIKLEKITQVVSLRGNLNLYKYSGRIFMLFFLLSKLFFSEVIQESIEISQALYTRNLNKENNNFLKIYIEHMSIDDYLCLVITAAYITILFLV